MTSLEKPNHQDGTWTAPEPIASLPFCDFRLGVINIWKSAEFNLEKPYLTTPLSTSNIYTIMHTLIYTIVFSTALASNSTEVCHHSDILRSFI